MKPRILALLQIPFVRLFGCSPSVQNPEKGISNLGATNALTNTAPPNVEPFDFSKLEVARGNILSADETSNRFHTITKDEATEIARKAAFRRGRNIIRVSSVSLDENGWLVGLKFEPEDEVGNYATVRITTNGAITRYYRGL